MATEEHCERALELHEEGLFDLPNVVGLGIASAGESDPGGEDVSPGDLAVAVYVEQKLPPEEVAEGDRIPRTLEFPGADGPQEVPVRVIEQGVIALEEFEVE